MGIKRGYNALQKVGIQSFLLGLILLTSFFVSYDVAHAALCVGSDPDTNCTATYADLDAAVTAAGATETIYINTDGDTSTGADIDDQNISLAPYPGINDATTIEITGIIAVSESAGGPLTFNMDTLTYKANSAINLEDLVAPTTGSITADFTDVVFNVQGGGDCIITSKSANDAPPAAASININGGSDIQNCGFADQDLIVDGDATNGYGGNLTITNSTISSPIYIDINDQMDTFTFTGNTITGAAAVSNAQIDVFHNAAVVNTLDINFDNNTYQNGFGASYIMLFDPGAPSVDNLSITGNTITNGTVNGSYFLAARSGSPVTLDFNNNTTAVAGAADKANVTVSSSATTINTFNDNDLPHAYILGSLAGINDAGGIHDNVFAGMNFSNTTGSTLLIEANVFTDFQSSAHTGVPVVTLSGTPANPGLFTVQNNVIEIPYSGDMQGVGTLNDAAAAIDTTDTGTLDIHNNTIVSNSVKSAALILDGENATTTTYDNNVMAANYSDASPDAAIQCDATNGSSFSAERNVFYKHKYIDNGSDCGVGGEIDEDISAINDESNPTTPSTGQAPDDMFEVLAEGTISGYPRGAISDFAAAFVPNAFVGDYLKLFNDNGSDAYYLRILSNTDTIISVLHDEIEPQMLDNQVGLTNEYEVTDLTPSDTSILVDSGTGPGGSVPGVDKDDVVRPQGNAVEQGA